MTDGMIGDGSSFHPQAICESTNVGSGTRIWAFVHVLAGAVIGKDCNICDGVFIENDVVIGDRVTIKSGVQLWDGLTIEDDVFIGPNATFTNDPFPRSKQYLPQYKRTIVRPNASIGANATILPGLEIGAGAMIGAGAVVTRSVPPNAIVIGNPARISGYAGVEHTRKKTSINSSGVLMGVPGDLGVSGARIIQLSENIDMRGSLTALEFKESIPFKPIRLFLVYGVPSIEVRGEHAHRSCQQLLCCVTGSCHAIVDDGTNRDEVVLDSPSMLLFVPPMIWGTQYKYSKDAVLLVLASEAYDPTDYIRSYTDFQSEITRRRG